MNYTKTLLRIDNAHEALKFYKENSSLKEIKTYIYDGNDLPKYDGKILRSLVELFNIKFELAETNDFKDRRFISMQINGSEFLDELKSFFHKLSLEGKVLSELELNFTDSWYGEVIDKFDVYWEFKLNPKGE